MPLEIQPLSPVLADVFCDYLTHWDFSATPVRIEMKVVGNCKPSTKSMSCGLI
jgi:hypothetical protein